MPIGMSLHVNDSESNVHGLVIPSRVIFEVGSLRAVQALSHAIANRPSASPTVWMSFLESLPGRRISTPLSKIFALSGGVSDAI